MKFHIFLFLGILLVSCNIEPEPISYGSDQCSYCKMTIMSKAHSAQMVTKKGKQFKYDAIECMMRDQQQNIEETQFGIIQVANFYDPGTMIFAGDATFVIDEKITSPMGANLAAINKENMREVYNKVYSWNELKQLFLQMDLQNPR